MEKAKLYIESETDNKENHIRYITMLLSIINEVNLTQCILISLLIRMN